MSQIHRTEKSAEPQLLTVVPQLPWTFLIKCFFFFSQGTFGVHEKFETVVSFVRENLEEEDLPFHLTTPTGHKLTEEDEQSSLVDLRLVPATILTFVANDVQADKSKMFLKGDVMLLVQPVT